jgi:hypothetical protein
LVLLLLVLVLLVLLLPLLLLLLLLQVALPCSSEPTHLRPLPQQHLPPHRAL